jgi:hypothetical protein
MGYLGVLESVRSRLTGKGSKFVPPFPSLEQLQKRTTEDIQNAGKRAEAVVPTSPKADPLTYVGGIHVPVFNFRADGANLDLIFPSISFDITGYTPRYAEFVYRSEDYNGDGVYHEPVENSKEEVFDGNGESLGIAARMVKIRPIEHPMDITVEVRVHTLNESEASYLVQYIYNVFPPRYFIRVPMRDGTYRSWDMLFEDFADLDRQEAVYTGAPGAVIEHTKVFTYRVEGYSDTTDQYAYVNRTRKRIITSSEIS